MQVIKENRMIQNFILCLCYSCYHLNLVFFRFVTDELLDNLRNFFTNSRMYRKRRRSQNKLRKILGQSKIRYVEG